MPIRRRRELYTVRDQSGLEVDFVIPGPGGRIRLVEAKASRTVRPDMTAAMRRLAESWAVHAPSRGDAEMFLVHERSPTGPATHAVAPGVKAMPWTEYFAATKRMR